MGARFEVYPTLSMGPNGQKRRYRWRLRAPNGEILAQGEAYNSKQGAKKGIASIKRNAGKAPVVELQ